MHSSIASLLQQFFLFEFHVSARDVIKRKEESSIVRYELARNAHKTTKENKIEKKITLMHI